MRWTSCSFVLGLLAVAQCQNAEDKTREALPEIQATDVVQQPPAPAEADANENPSFTHVIKAETVYYKTGPQQGRPPDGKFQTGAKVRVIENAGSYVRVRSEDSVEAFIAADSLKKVDNE